MDKNERLYRAAVGMMNDHCIPKRVRVRFFMDMIHERFDKDWCESSAIRASVDPDVPDEDWANEGFELNCLRGDVLTRIARELMRIELGRLGKDQIAFLRRCYHDLTEDFLEGFRQHLESRKS